MCVGELEQELIEGSDYSGARLRGEGAGRLRSTNLNTSKDGAPSVGLSNSVMESLWEDGSYMGELMLCDRFVLQARDDLMSQIRHIEPV